MFDRFKDEIQAIKERDPAARTAIEIMLLYPGYKAVRAYRRANWCFRRNWFFMAGLISQRAVRRTGIEIHPGATIGRRLFIDHGTGVVIGETTEIGDDVTIFQGVTLGGTGKDIGKRHPTLGNGVLVGAGAKILGPFKVGDNAKIAAGAVVLDEVPPDSTAVGVPARIVKANGMKRELLDQVHVPDPISQQFCQYEQRLRQLEQEIQQLKENDA